MTVFADNDMIVHQLTRHVIALISQNVSNHSNQQGTSIGGGECFQFFIITLRHDGFQSLNFDPDERHVNLRHVTLTFDCGKTVEQTIRDPDSVSAAKALQERLRAMLPHALRLQHDSTSMQPIPSRPPGERMRTNTRDLCNSYSAECLKAAEDTRDRTRKAIMLEMAMAWLALADHADDIGRILTDRVVDRSKN